MANTSYWRVYNTLIDLYGCQDDQAKEIYDFYKLYF